MNSLFNFSVEHFRTLCKQKMPLECIFLLEMIKYEVDVDNQDYITGLQRLQRKGYIDSKGKLTQYGEELYNSMWEDAVETKVQKRKKVDGSKFEEWWAVYPTTNFFEIEGREFKGTQNKRIKKEECEKLFTLLCVSLSPDDIIKATAFHIQTAKEISYKKKENQLTYIANSERYLREKFFEPYLERAKKAELTAVTKKDFEI